MRIHLAGAVLVLTFAAGLPAAAPPARVDPALLGGLFRKLDAEDFFVRQKADADLRAMGKRVVAALREEMDRTRSLEVRWRLSRMVHDLTIDERVGDLVRLLNDSDAHMRERAGYALRQAGPGVVPLLRKELKPELASEQRRRLEKIITELAGR